MIKCKGKKCLNVNFEVNPSLKSTKESNILILTISKKDLLLDSNCLTVSLLTYRLLLELNNEKFNYNYELKLLEEKEKEEE